MVAAVLALTALAFKVSGLSLDGSRPTYRLVAKFDNVADLHARAKVSISGVEIGRVARVVGKLISLSVHNAFFDTRSGHPHRETARMMVAAIVLFGECTLAIDRPSKFAAPDHQRIV